MTLVIVDRLRGAGGCPRGDGSLVPSALGPRPIERRAVVGVIVSTEVICCALAVTLLDVGFGPAVVIAACTGVGAIALLVVLLRVHPRPRPDARQPTRPRRPVRWRSRGRIRPTERTRAVQQESARAGGASPRLPRDRPVPQVDDPAHHGSRRGIGVVLLPPADPDLRERNASSRAPEHSAGRRCAPVPVNLETERALVDSAAVASLVQEELIGATLGALLELDVRRDEQRDPLDPRLRSGPRPRTATGPGLRPGLHHVPA